MKHTALQMAAPFQRTIQGGTFVKPTNAVFTEVEDGQEQTHHINQMLFNGTSGF